MKALMDLRDMLCVELEEEARKGELTAGSLETVHKLTDTVKNIDKILMLEEGGYSGDGEWNARGSYAGDNSYRRGSYSRGGSYADGGYAGASYRGGRHYVHGHYSRAEGQDMVKERIQEMMRQGGMSGGDMDVLNRAMEILDNR